MRQGWVRVALGLAAAMLASLAGCGSGTSSSNGAPDGPTPQQLTAGGTSEVSGTATGSEATTTLPSLPATGAPGTAVASPTAATVVLRDADDGRSVSVARGTHIVVTLASTYWTIAPSSNQAAVRDAGKQTYSPQLRGCVPGGGCGSVSAGFDATGAGTAALTASRTSCGEAMGCTGSAGRWAVTVVVTG